MSKLDKRFIRQDAIRRHLWMIDYPWEIGKYNLRLVVRLYEKQLYGYEMNLYKS